MRSAGLQIRRVSGWLILILFVAACAQKRNQRSVSEDRLVEVLMDVHTAEAALAFLYGEKRDTFAENYYEDIFAIHNLSQEEFDRWMAALREDPEWMVEVYQKVLDRLDEEVAE